MVSRPALRDRDRCRYSDCKPRSSAVCRAACVRRDRHVVAQRICRRGRVFAVARGGDLAMDARQPACRRLAVDARTRWPAGASRSRGPLVPRSAAGIAQPRSLAGILDDVWRGQLLYYFCRVMGGAVSDAGARHVARHGRQPYQRHVAGFCLGFARGGVPLGPQRAPASAADRQPCGPCCVLGAAGARRRAAARRQLRLVCGVGGKRHWIHVGVVVCEGIEPAGAVRHGNELRQHRPVHRYRYPATAGRMDTRPRLARRDGRWRAYLCP